MQIALRRQEFLATANIPAVATDPVTRVPAARMHKSLDHFEEAFEREQEIEEQRRHELRLRASNRSRARQIVKTEKRGRVRFSVLFVCLTSPWSS